MPRYLPRRTILRGAGKAAIALPLLDAMVTLGGFLPARRARAAAAPKRLILFFTGNGFTMSSWRPTSASGAPLQLGPVLAPLEPIKADVLQLEGLPYSCVFDPESRGKSHPGGSVACFTGAYPGPGNQYNGTKDSTGGPPLSPSIDHIAAQTLGRDTKFPLYHLGVMTGFGRSAIMHRCFYGPAQAIVNPKDDPQLVFNQLFSDVAPRAPNAAADLAADAQLTRRRRLLDLVLDDYRSLRCRLGAEDRARLDGHLASVADLQRRIATSTGAATGAACAPVRPAAAGDLGSFPTMQAAGPLQIELAAMALACDLTRLIGIQWHCADTENRGIYGWLGTGNDISHHDITHLRGSNPEAAKASIGQYHAKQVLTLVQRLKSLPEGGGNVMDGTLLLWGTDIANDRGAHDNRNAGYTIVGNAGGGLRTGRYVRYPGTDQYANNRLLLTVLQALGVPATSVGAAGYGGAGPLADLAR
jgi:hypothetical protein